MKKKLVLILRKFGLMQLADRFRYFYHFLKTRKARKDFLQKHHTVVIPPPYHVYETYRLNYKSYYFGGKETAVSLIEDFKKYKTLSNIKILDWGCGPGRIVRHLPNLLPDCDIYGSDYNYKYIEWCNENLPEITFKTNDLTPPLQFEQNYFDLIYGISIFTHLSEKMHFSWVEEFKRVLKPGGILYITAYGLAFRQKLSDADKTLFDAGRLVYSKKTKEGHRTFVAFHSEKFMKELFSDFEILSHNPGKTEGLSISQDVWIVRKII